MQKLIPNRRQLQDAGLMFFVSAVSSATFYACLALFSNGRML